MPLQLVPLSKLLGEVRACTACASHLPLGPRPVLQVHSAARILIAAQAPGRKVHATGVPFDDASGDRLREWLGLSRAIFYDARKVAILPMGFCYPGRAGSGDAPPRPECAPRWREALLSRLANVELTLVIGRYAIDYHLPDARASLTETVREFVQSGKQARRNTGPALVAMPHPSPRNNGWLKQNPWFEAELLPSVRSKVAKLL